MEAHVTDLENSIRTGNMAQVSSEPTLIAGHIKGTQTAVINIVTGQKRGIVSPALISVMVSEVLELDDTLIFHTKIPLVDEEEYDVYHLTPIPVVMQHQIIAKKTETKYLTISDHRDRHFALTMEVLMQCTKMSKGPVMCNVKQTTLGPANEQLQCALAAIQAEQKTICRP
nr:uncharacterized protein LOC118879061 [Drosophila suzukii]